MQRLKNMLRGNSDGYSSALCAETAE